MSNLHRIDRRSGNTLGKMAVRRHGSKFSKTSAARCEKVYETKARSVGRSECEEGLEDWENEA